MADFEAEVMLTCEGKTVQDGELQGVLQAEHRSGGKMVVLWKFMTEDFLRSFCYDFPGPWVRA